MAFSPKGTFIVTWRTYTSDLREPDGNLVVWSVAEEKAIAKFIQKNYSSANWYHSLRAHRKFISFRPSVRWSEDESVCTRMVNNQILFFEPTRLGFHINCIFSHF